MKEFQSKLFLGDSHNRRHFKGCAEMGGFKPGLPMTNGGLGIAPFLGKLALSEAVLGPVFNQCI